MAETRATWQCIDRAQQRNAMVYNSQNKIFTMKKKVRIKPGKNPTAPPSILSFTDPLTGQKIQSDVTYSGFFGAAPNSFNSYASGSYELELSSKKIVVSMKKWDWIDKNPPRPNRIDVSRAVFTGEYTFRGGAISGKTSLLSYFNAQKDADTNYFMENAQSYAVNASAAQPDPLRPNPSLLTSVNYFYSNISDKASFDSNNNYPAAPLYSSRADIGKLPDTSFFQEGWWEDPFSANLI